MALSGFQRASYRIFGGFSSRHLVREELGLDLIKARLPIRMEAYVATALSTTLITLLVSVLFAAFAGLVLLPGLGLSAMNPMVLVALIMVPILFAGAAYVILLTSPKSKARSRGKSIDEHLPYGLNYVAAMASAGVQIHTIFESLGEQPIYGELSTEARSIAKDMKLGTDSTMAMDRAAKRSPSSRWSEVMQGAITTVTSGGDLKNYFGQKAERYAWENRQQAKKFVEVMGLMAETYVTAAVAGPLFLIVMMAIMAMLGGGDLTMLRMITYMLLPIANLGFAFGLQAMSPKV